MQSYNSFRFEIHIISPWLGVVSCYTSHGRTRQNENTIVPRLNAELRDFGLVISKIGFVHIYVPYSDTSKWWNWLSITIDTHNAWARYEWLSVIWKYV